jgi:hypothetical protein
MRPCLTLGPGCAGRRQTVQQHRQQQTQARARRGDPARPLPAARQCSNPSHQRRARELSECRPLLDPAHRGGYGVRTGASRMARLNSVAGIRPPTMENASTAAYCSAGGTCGAKASKVPPAMARKPVPSKTSGGTPRPSSRPAVTLPRILTAAASAVSPATQWSLTPACA